MIDRVFDGRSDRVRIHMPPRHGKSETVTIRAVLYYLKNRPGVRILITGYNASIAKKFSRRIRNQAEEMGIKLSRDKTATDEWYTEDGSLVMARGVGSPPTGEGFDLIVIDDPIRKRADAESEAFREKLWSWYTDDLLTRLQPKGAILGIWTRWHEDDLAGRLDAAGRDGADAWEILKLPAINDAGEALWPEMWPIDALLRRKAAMIKRDGARSWEALFQQNPTPATGDVFDISKLTILTEIPELVEVARAWDVAASASSGDHTAGVKMGRTADGRYVILHVDRFRCNSGERDSRMRSTAEADGRDVPVLVPQDPGAAGKAQVAAWIRMFAGYQVVVMPTSGSKEVRAGPVSTQVNNGNVFLAPGAWNHDFIEELRTFPGTHDDQVDALSDVFTQVSKAVDWFVVVA